MATNTAPIARARAIRWVRRIGRLPHSTSSLQQQGDEGVSAGGNHNESALDHTVNNTHAGHDMHPPPSVSIAPLKAGQAASTTDQQHVDLFQPPTHHHHHLPRKLSRHPPAGCRLHPPSAFIVGVQASCSSVGRQTVTATRGTCNTHQQHTQVRQVLKALDRILRALHTGCMRGDATMQCCSALLRRTQQYCMCAATGDAYTHARQSTQC